MTWSLTWRLGGASGTVDDVDVAWSESVSLTRSEGNWRSASVDVVIPVDFTTLRVNPRTGYAQIAWNGNVQITGRWKGTQYEPLPDGRARVSFDVSDVDEDDKGRWPPSGDVYPRRDPDEVSTWDLVAVEGARTWGGAGGRLPDTLEVVPILSSTEFPDIAEPADGQVWPYPMGRPGRGEVRPACPAYVYDTRTGGGNSRKAGISGVPVSCTTITVYGPRYGGTAANAPSNITDSATGIAVHHATRENGTAFAYFELADIYTLIDNSPDNSFWWSAEQDAAPSGAGDVILDALTASTRQIDFLAWRSVAPRLNAYLLDGYSDGITSPTEFLRAQVFPLLPLSAVPGPRGLRPVLWPWLDDTEARGIDVVDGVGIATGSVVSYMDAQALASMRITFGYDPNRGIACLSTAANGGSTVYAVTSEAAVESAEMEARLIWHRATAQQVANDSIRWRSWSPRVVELQIRDRDRYGPGGTEDLYPGRRIVLYADRLGINGMAAMVGDREYDSERALVRVYMLDDPLTPI